MSYIQAFENLTKSDTSTAGGKGASLGEMTQAGIPVPPGFVVLTDAFERFAEETDLTQEIQTILSKVDIDAIHTVDEASEQIQGLILSREMPEDIKSEILEAFKKLDTEFVAVRSSATSEDGADAAWAGQLDSYLNTTEESLLQNVQKCWASLFTPRAIFYRFEKELHDTFISVAVVVQKMVNSEHSGIAFSVHPVTEDHNQIIIEAGIGLGEAIVSGSITPDSYVVTKEPREIIDINVSTQNKALYRKEGGGNEWRDLQEEQANKQVLSEKEVKELSEIVVTIEDYYGFPCDIEWAYEGGEFYIVQSRPITTLSNIEISDDTDKVKQKFVKAYTRNFSIVMQQAWYAANKESLISKLGLTEYPYNPPYIYFMKDGVEEVWENTKANKWLLNQLSEKISLDKDFFTISYERYFKRLESIKEWWGRDINNLDDLNNFLDLMYEGVSDFVLIYGVLMLEDAPEHIKGLAEKFREEDVFFSECNSALSRALKNIYPDLGHLAVYLTRDELSSDIGIEELRKRDKGFALLPGIFQGVTTFKELEERFPEYTFVIEKGEQYEGGLKGQIAYGGKVQGVVRVVKRIDQAEKVKKGEVIVSPMTTPDFLPAMKKASAFVTDEGGITCHAAIIAREMRKPCVIGTKIATDMFKDGDMVEVDADNGVVRVMSEEDMLPTIHKDEWEFSYETEGYYLLIEEIITKYYLLWPSLSFGLGGVVQVYVPKETIKELKQKSLDITLDDIEKAKKEIEQYHEETKETHKKYAKQVTKEDLSDFFLLLSKICKSYTLFDIYYSDGIYESDPKDPRAIKIEELKNYLRDKLDFIFFKKDGWIETILKTLSDTFDIGVQDIKLYREQELFELFDGKKVTKQNLIERGDVFIFLRDSKEITDFYQGENASKIASVFSREYKSVGTVQGKIAHGKGRVVTGRVARIVRDYDNHSKTLEEMDQMNKGDILISQTTDPELMPALRKAGAVVTDLGGMLSHSAISARELDIPCIIATEYATKIFKTGDMVEVDADNGVVRVLERGEIDDSEDLFNKLEKYKFSVRSQYPIFPTLFFEPAITRYIDNPYLQSKDSPGFIYMIDDGVDVWMDEHKKVLIEDDVMIRKIADECIGSYEDLTLYVDKSNVSDFLDISVLKEILGKIEDLYKTYCFFADESFDTSNTRLLEELPEIRLKVSEYLTSKLFPYLIEIIEKISKEKSIPENVLKNALISDLDKIWEGDYGDIANRSRSALIFANGEVSYVIDIDLFARLKKYLDSKAPKPDTGLLRGVSANNGKVAGRVVVLHGKDYDKAGEILAGHKDYILVTPMTRPEILQYMKNAKAFVTDEGGITCHAAIVAREMKKPCVIGTKFATQVFKDGDIVEVDADNGVVRVVKQ